MPNHGLFSRRTSIVNSRPSPSPPISVHAWIRRRDICQDGRVSLDEFVASFRALVPPDTSSWASASTATAGGPAGFRQSWHSRANSGTYFKSTNQHDIDDVAAAVIDNDGASDVTAAFGRVRLSASIPECRAAAEYALEYCRRVKDSPSAQLHWRIPLSSRKFSSTVGRY